MVRDRASAHQNFPRSFHPARFVNKSVAIMVVIGESSRSSNQDTFDSISNFFFENKLELVILLSQLPGWFIDNWEGKLYKGWYIDGSIGKVAENQFHIEYLVVTERVRLASLHLLYSG